MSAYEVSAATIPSSEPGFLTLLGDGHGPGLPSELDPDDDDDGVQDADDSHPNDPTRGTKSAPGPIDPIADNDGDGLPNVMDPDDTDNGIPDATEGVGTNDLVPAPGKEPARAPDPGSPAFPDGEKQGSLVQALPSTGTGADDDQSMVPILLIGGVLLLATSHWTRRGIRP